MDYHSNVLDSSGEVLALGTKSFRLGVGDVWGPMVSGPEQLVTFYVFG